MLPSLQYFNSSFMSLSSPHPIWVHANSPYEVSKAVVTARMLSGRYRTDRLTRHWTQTNPEGLCRLPGCNDQEGTLSHILLSCPALSQSRSNMIRLWSSFMVSRPLLLPIIYRYTIEEPECMVQLILDPTCLPLVVSCKKSAPEVLQHCLYLGRTWCLSTHTLRSRLLKENNLK